MAYLKPRDVKVIHAASNVSDKKLLRVAAYCRVSTDSDDQVNSFIAQVKYYNDFIRLSDGMELVDIYADEGITGTSTGKREEFKRMIKDSRLGKIDRIYVKSVTRFARNTSKTVFPFQMFLSLKRRSVGNIDEKITLIVRFCKIKQLFYLDQIPAYLSKFMLVRP